MSPPEPVVSLATISVTGSAKRRHASVWPVDGAIGRMGGAAPGSDGHNMDHFCLQLDPFHEDEIRAHLEANGVEVGPVAERYGALGNGPSLYIKDPEGNTVELEGPGTQAGG